MIKRRVILLMLCITWLIAGCDSAGSPPAGAGSSSQSKFVGTWITSQKTMKSRQDLGMRLNADGTLRLEDASLDFLGGKMVITGVWREDGGNLYTTFQDLQLIGIPGNDQKVKDNYRDQLVKMFKVGKEAKNVITWVTPRQFKIEDGTADPSVYNKRD